MDGQHNAGEEVIERWKRVFLGIFDKFSVNCIISIGKGPCFINTRIFGVNAIKFECKKCKDKRDK